MGPDDPGPSSRSPHPITRDTHDLTPSPSDNSDSNHATDVGSRNSWARTLTSCDRQCCFAGACSDGLRGSIQDTRSHHSYVSSLSLFGVFPPPGLSRNSSLYVQFWCGLPLFRHPPLSDIPRVDIGSFVPLHFSCARLHTVLSPNLFTILTRNSLSPLVFYVHILFCTTFWRRLR